MRRVPRPAESGDRETFFRSVQGAIAEYYLADPSNPYQQSGRSSGAARWEETRRILVKALHRDGDFMDVGCANGLLLETLIWWAAEDGFTLRPHGIDFVEGLVNLARARFPGRADNFAVANAFHWSPSRQYDFVRTNIEYVPRLDWSTFVRHQHAAVAPGGRLILCHYRNAGDADDPYVDLRDVASDAGYAVAGRVEVHGTAIAWIDKT
jgi:2-polyprenyl-3-methyl-5-hydroxy-6-metoxy-1,4-benzoquinol methylase